MGSKKSGKLLETVILDIKRFSIDDGPGIRTTVFLKGCSLHCQWCHNPESMHREPEVQYFPHLCTGCQKCVKACPVNAQRMESGKRKFIRDLCKHCGKCVEACNNKALVMAGKRMTVAQVLKEVEKDKIFYDRSGGGVTFSGGEPLLHPGFLFELLKKVKAKGIHTAVETAGNVPWKTFEDVLPYTDLFLYDVKVIDEEKHKAFTGVSNKQIVENLKKLGTMKTALSIRIPVIPGVNDTAGEMERIACLVKDFSAVTSIELMPYHNIAQGKYESLGIEYKFKDITALSTEQIVHLTKVFAHRNLPVNKN